MARIAAHESWARTPNRTARTAKARAALMATFELQVDPHGVLSPAERAVRAESARKAYFARLALKSAQTRRQAREASVRARRPGCEPEPPGGAAA